MLTRLTLALVALTLAPTALAADADEVLTKLETALSNYDDQYIRFEVLNAKPGQKNPSSMSFSTKVKGPKAYTEFLSPGDIKGTRVLTMSPTQMWVYLPEYGRVRRVASHATEQGFMGTTLSQQDIGPPAYSTLFDVTLSGEDEDSWTLELKAKDGVDVAYKTLKMDVDKKLNVPVKIEHLNDKGELARTETRTDYTCESGYCLFGKLKMVDHSRGDAWTELKPVEMKLNPGLSDDIFSVRSLQLGQ